MMTDQEEQSLKEIRRAEKRTAEEAKHSAREQAIENDQKARKLKTKSQ